MKLSVIIPCYNAERFLGACLDSLLSQDFSDFEAILIDDGSKDQTAEIAQQYAKRDKRIVFLSQRNAGVSAARNTGLRAARGEWIFFLDADDLLPEGALFELLSCAKDGAEMVVSLHETFDESGKTEIVFPETLWMKKQGAECRHAAALRLIEGDAVLNVMCNKLHLRAALVREGIVLVEGIRMAEDALFNLEAVLCAQKIAFCDHVTYRYRIHSASATQTRTLGEFETHLPWLSAMKKMLLRRDLWGAYYPAYVASVVLRLYKDGGVMGVMREFNKKARPLLIGAAKANKLSVCGRVLYFLCETKLYPPAYPFIFPFELFARKRREIAFRLRLRRKSRG